MNRPYSILLRLFLVAAIALSFAFPAAAQTPFLSSAPRLAPPYPLPERAWRIPVSADDLYALSYETLFQAGAPVTTTPPDAYQLSWMGQPVAMLAQGMTDGAFDAGDAFIFYGQKFHGSEQDEKYTDENIYWLTIDDTTPGLRMTSRSVAPQPEAPLAESYLATLLSEEDNYYWARWSTQPGTSATWFWKRALAVTKPVTRTYPLQLSGVISATASATLRVEVAARNATPANNPDHHLRWSVNGTEVGEDKWEGKVGRVFTTTVPAALLHEGENQLQLTLLPDVGIQDIYFDRAILTYSRAFIAQEDRLFFSAPADGAATYTLTGFSALPPLLLDISDALRPTLLTDAQPAANPDSITFTDSTALGTPYAAFVQPMMATASAYSPPDGILHSTPGADEIIIVPSAFYTTTLPLAEQRRSEGLRVQVVSVEDLYVLFGGGVFHPRAIRDFLAYTYTNWPDPSPAYVLLVGDGHFNFKGHNPAVYGELRANWIPPYLDFVDPFQGEVAVDSRYAAIVGDDNFPDMAIGRLPVNSVAELEDVIAKLLAYSSDPAAPWARRALFVSDNVPDNAGDFDAVIDTLEAATAPGMLRQHLSLTDSCGAPNTQPNTCAISATEVLTQTWSEGVALLTYSGHGSIHRWAHEPLLTNTQLPSLQSGGGLPFVLSLDCLDGYFMMPPSYPGLADARSLAEVALTLPERGAIAYFAPSGLGTTYEQQTMALALYDALYQKGERRLGALTQAARLAVFDTHLAEIYTLFGDPAMPLNINPDNPTISLPLMMQ